MLSDPPAYPVPVVTFACFGCGAMTAYASRSAGIAAGWRSIEGDQSRLVCPSCAGTPQAPVNRRQTRAQLARARSKRKPGRVRH